MEFPMARLEEWMRRAYFEADFDIGSSGVENYRLRELRELVGLSLDQLDDVVFHDSNTLGDFALRQAIAHRYAGGKTERVMATHGSTEANYLLHLALVNPGEEVIALASAYQQLWSLAQGLGASVRFWRLRPENRFHPDLDDLRKLISPRTRIIIVNFPHNPTGAGLSREEQHELVAAAERCGAWLIWDAAFAELVYTAPPLPNPATWYPRAVSMGTLSKAFGLPGMRVGWCIAPPEIINRLTSLRDYVSLHLSPLVELIARSVLKHADQILANRLSAARANLAHCERWASAQREFVEWIAPQGGVTAFPRLLHVDSDEVCRRLIAHHRVLTVPGSCFGCPEHIRLGFGGARGELEVGLDRLAKVFHEST